MSRSSEFHDAAGRHYVEGEMPKEIQYDHPLRSYGEPRRLSVFDPKETRSFRTSRTGGFEEHPEGQKGLIGYTDFYREEPQVSRFSVKHVDGTVEHEENVIQDVNVGYMRVHDSHRGAGVGRQMFDYLEKTTPSGQQLNLGKVAHDSVQHMADKTNKENPGRVKYKFF